MIVGQGQLDSILHATPEGRRGFIEEAAGVLKHRKRKEKALRKLEAMQANLTRLVDLTGELRRRLGRDHAALLQHGCRLLRPVEQGHPSFLPPWQTGRC